MLFYKPLAVGTKAANDSLAEVEGPSKASGSGDSEGVDQEIEACDCAVTFSISWSVKNIIIFQNVLSIN